ncbi:hypothetical protein P4O66_004942, partial [Electrophorus voltai]
AMFPSALPSLSSESKAVSVSEPLGLFRPPLPNRALSSQPPVSHPIRHARAAQTRLSKPPVRRSCRGALDGSALVCAVCEGPPRRRCCSPGTRLRLVGRLLPGELGLSWSPRPRCSQLQLALVALAWFPRLYLHYCSQWLYLHARDIPVNRFRFHAHTVDVVYQGSLLSTPEEALLVLLGPLTLNTVTLGLLLIRWVCRQAFGSTPSFLSKLIMAAGAWTVLDPLAVLVVDAGLGRLSYSAEEPVADAAKLYWHFHRTEHSGAAGIFITLFLYTVHFTLSVTVLYVYLLRLHNDGRVLDVYHRLHSPEGAFFIPDDLEVSNQELSYIVKKAEQWRGFNGERRKVAVHDYIWMEEESGASQSPGGVATTAGETSTHVSIYTLYVSSLRRRHRHFLRQPNGAIIEVGLPSLSVSLTHPSGTSKQCTTCFPPALSTSLLLRRAIKCATFSAWVKRSGADTDSRTEIRSRPPENERNGCSFLGTGHTLLAPLQRATEEARKIQHSKRTCAHSRALAPSGPGRCRHSDQRELSEELGIGVLLAPRPSAGAPLPGF